jgi:hypothetical protein
MLKWLLEEWDGVDWIKLAQYRDQWRATVNTVMNLQVPKNCWEFSEWLHNWQLPRKGSAPYVSKFVRLSLSDYLYLG